MASYNGSCQGRPAVTSLIAQHAMFQIRISNRGPRFASPTNTQMKSGTESLKRAHYKDFAGAKPASAWVDGQGGEETTMSFKETVGLEPEFVAFVDWPLDSRAIGTRRRSSIFSRG